MGGGSSMDAAKLAAFMAGDTTQELEEVYGVDLCQGKRLPLIQVSKPILFVKPALLTVQSIVWEN